VIFVPLNYRRLLWGWPNLFVARLAEANSEAFLIGPMNSNTETAGSTAIDEPQLLKPFVSGYAGGISTDRIDLIGPALGRPARSVTKEVPPPEATPQRDVSGSDLK
jgi:glycerophosphoryl diester phosphodiesterase